MTKETPRLAVEQLILYIKEDEENILLSELQQLASSVPKFMQSVAKRKGDLARW